MSKQLENSTSSLQAHSAPVATKHFTHLDLLLVCLGFALILIGLFINHHVGTGRGEDLAQIYISGNAFIHGQNIFDIDTQRRIFIQETGSVPTWGMFYPPSAGIAVTYLNLFPYHVARVIWFWLMHIVLIAGFWLLCKLFFPEKSHAWRTLMIGLVLCASSIRWGFQLYQSAPLIVGLLCIFLYGLYKEHPILAITCAWYAICIKPSIAIAFIGVLALQRKWKQIFILVCLVIITNGIGFARMGGMEAIQGYKTNIAHLEDPGKSNSLDATISSTQERTDWAFLLCMFGMPEKAGRIGGVIISLLVLGVFVYAGSKWRHSYLSQEALLVFLPAILLFSMLCVYHHRYDTSMLIPVLFILLVQQPAKQSHSLSPLFYLPLFAYIFLYPVYQVQTIVIRILGYEGTVLLKGVAGIVLNIALYASLYQLIASPPAVKVDSSKDPAVS